MPYPFDKEMMTAILGQYQNPYQVPQAPGLISAPALSGGVSQGVPGAVPNASLPESQQGPTAARAKKTKKDGGMWDSILEAFASGIAGAKAPQLAGYPGLNSASVGARGAVNVPGRLYDGGNFNSILAAYLR